MIESVGDEDGYEHLTEDKSSCRPFRWIIQPTSATSNTAGKDPFHNPASVMKTTQLFLTNVIGMDVERRTQKKNDR